MPVRRQIRTEDFATVPNGRFARRSSVGTIGSHQIDGSSSSAVRYLQSPKAHNSSWNMFFSIIHERQLPCYDFMKPTEVIRSYIDSWNGRDAEVLVAAFAEDGKFCNPHTYPGVGGEALAEFVKRVWTAFPDFHLETDKLWRNRARVSRHSLVIAGH